MPGAAGRFDAGIENAIRFILTSPHFLFREEPDPATVSAGAVYPVSDLELASRLSFFLWSSVPDDQRLTVATQGRLKEPSVLDRQVRRMLADPKSKALVDNFAAQWLFVCNLQSVLPDTASERRSRPEGRREVESTPAVCPDGAPARASPGCMGGLTLQKCAQPWQTTTTTSLSNQ